VSHGIDAGFFVLHVLLDPQVIDLAPRREGRIVDTVPPGRFLTADRQVQDEKLYRTGQLGPGTAFFSPNPVATPNYEKSFRPLLSPAASSEAHIPSTICDHYLSYQLVDLSLSDNPIARLLALVARNSPDE